MVKGINVWKKNLASPGRLALACFLALLIWLVCMIPMMAHAANSNGTAVGVIRWDAQIGSSATGTLAGVGPDEERAMAPSVWHFRLPFYATEPTANSDTMNGTTQAIMDQEIAYAKDAGINYWAFDWYGSETGMQTQRNLYLSSTHKNDVNWAIIMFTHPLSSTDQTWLITQFQTSNYQKVAGGRPLVYAYNYSALVDTAQITAIRSQTFAAMGVQPYIVALDYGSSNAAAFAAQIGADAVSSYVTTGSNGNAYSIGASAEQSNWNNYKATGYPVIPWVTQGWDPRPRINLSSPPYGYASYPANSYETASTPTELANQLQSAINWNANNAASAPANAVLMYAWNEFSEGGYICPTLIPGGGGVNRNYLDAIKGVNTTPVGGGSSFVTGKTLSGTIRNNYGDYVGTKITVGSTPITVTQLGRYYVAGNSGTHTLKIVNASTGADLASSVINMSTGTADGLGFKYVALNTPQTLAANTAYYIVSLETNGGDQWYDGNTALTATSAAVINSNVYKNGSYVTSGSTGNSFGPVNFKYTSGTNLALGKTYSASSQWDASQAGAKAFDGSNSTNWQAGSGTTFNGQWVQVDFGSSTTFGRAVINEYLDNRTSGYRIEYWNGSSWATAYTGTTIGPNKTVTFTPVTGTKARIYFTSGLYTPIIFEFEVYSS
ncbi:hypothetical protein EHS13_31940 [Paenibacillus psychroresistens]|uniref:F5/8 type C domain-containing protein n=1 Tax=Paenibacillus psychroresistens TaxID=1778678 RepID=A0A6B8RRZ0_9BACL|nr:discoidin domain-containing protein [Paenibacillus psychroresistens]QGQ99160.1 hypothetical protein EHS13_31940 [Paenibacillus psychroresistens]